MNSNSNSKSDIEGSSSSSSSSSSSDEESSLNGGNGKNKQILFTATKESHFYEQLGAPTILYRYTPSSNSTPGSSPDPDPGPIDEDSYKSGSYHNWKPHVTDISDLDVPQMNLYTDHIIDSIHRQNRARIMYYYPGTLGRSLPSRLSLINNTNTNANANNGTRSQTRSGSHSSSDSGSGSRNKYQHRHKYDRKSSFLTLSNHYQRQDDEDGTRNYANPPKDGNDNDIKSLAMSESTLKMKYKIQRMHSCPKEGYSAPFTEIDVRICLGGSEIPSTFLDGKGDRTEVGKDVRSIKEKPFFYGNCLALFPCSCIACVGNNVGNNVGNDNRNRNSNIKSEGKGMSSAKTTSPDNSHDRESEGNKGNVNVNTIAKHQSLFLLYPKGGQNIAVSSIRMPQTSQMEQVRVNGNGKGKGKGITNQLDVGARVMQIQGCFNANEPQSITDKMPFVVRTAKDCSMILCSTIDDHGDDNDDDQNGNSSTCTRKYNLQNIAKLTFDDGNGNGLEPIHIAAKQQNSTLQGGTVPTFATVCKSRIDMVMGDVGPNVIHYTTCGGNGIDTLRYKIHNLASISLINFSTMNPNVLWSAARSNLKHELYQGRRFQKRPTIGYGHSLHSIDLRSSKASFVWSPSDDDFVCTGIHSVTGIFVEDENPYSIFASTYSSSEGKVYHIDARMPARSLYSWTLAGLCDEERVMNSPSGIYGSGMMLAKAIHPYSGFGLDLGMDFPILGAKKEPQAFGFHIFQKPSKLGNFQTRNLEKMANTGLDPLGAFATSSFHALPDVSERVFTTGIAAFYSPISSLVKEPQLLGYETPPNLALCIISANSRGDLYSYSMAACPGGQPGLSQAVNGGPLGACAVSLQDGSFEVPDVDTSNDGLAWTLSNTYPSTESGRSTIKALPKSQYCILNPTKTSHKTTRIQRDDLITIKHSSPEKEFGTGFERPPISRHLVAHLPKGNREPIVSIGSKRRHYNIKEPSENLKSIVSKLRSRKSINTSL